MITVDYSSNTERWVETELPTRTPGLHWNDGGNTRAEAATHCQLGTEPAGRPRPPLSDMGNDSGQRHNF